jgi:hypothetical protein
MGNSEPKNSNLRIHLETDKPFYNSGSTIVGAIYVHANEQFYFDALLIRVEGTIHPTQATSSANGSRAAQRTAGNMLATNVSTPNNTSSTSTRPRA